MNQHTENQPDQKPSSKIDRLFMKARTVVLTASEKADILKIIQKKVAETPEK